jgi:hypothetical protein
MDGKSLARSEAKSPKGCEQDAINNTRKTLNKKTSYQPPLLIPCSPYDVA